MCNCRSGCLFTFAFWCTLEWISGTLRWTSQLPIWILWLFWTLFDHQGQGVYVDWWKILFAGWKAALPRLGNDEGWSWNSTLFRLDNSKFTFRHQDWRRWATNARIFVLVITCFLQKSWDRVDLNLDKSDRRNLVSWYRKSTTCDAKREGLDSYWWVHRSEH